MARKMAFIRLSEQRALLQIAVFRGAGVAPANGIGLVSARGPDGTRQYSAGSLSRAGKYAISVIAPPAAATNDRPGRPSFAPARGGQVVIVSIAARQ
jgi:hypothetical protein